MKTGFPTWIEGEREPERRAALRLKYLLSMAALNHYGRCSMHDVARDIECHHSSIFNAINRGYFSEAMAQSIERLFGRDALPYEALVKPLEIGQGANINT